MAKNERSLTVRFGGNSGNFSKAAEEVRKKLKELNTALVENKQKIKDTNQEIKDLKKRQQELAAQMKDGGTKEQQKEMRDLSDRVAQANAKLGSLMATQSELKSSIKGANTQLDNMRQGFSNLSAAVEAFKAAGAVMALKEIYSGFVDCVNIAMEFHSVMSSVAALSGASDGEMNDLSELAKQLGATTKFTATEAAQAMSYMAMAGWNAQEMAAGMDGVMALAAASGEDLAGVADIVTDNLTAFGLTAADTAHFADVLAAAATNSNTNVSIMGETFKNSAALAGALGYSIEDVAVAVGLMANAGIKGSNAGTALKNMFGGLLDGITLSAEAFGQVEYSAVNADGTMKSLGQTLEELRYYFDQMTGAEQLHNAKLIVGERGLAGFVSILNTTEEAYQSLTDAINNCAGAAGSMAEIKMDNLAGDVTLMQSALDALKTTIGEAFEPELRMLAQAATGLLNGVNDFAKANPVLTKSILAVAGALGTAAAATIALTAAKKTLNLLLGSSTSLFKGLLSAINPAMLGITLLSATVGAFIAKGEEATRVTSEYNMVIDRLDKAARETISDAEKENEALERKAKRYDELRTAAERSAAEETELRDIAAELQEVFGDDIDVVDALTGKYNDLSVAVENYTNKRLLLAKRSAAKDQLEGYYQERAELKRQIETLTAGWTQGDIDAAWAFSSGSPDWMAAFSAGALDVVAGLLGNQSVGGTAVGASNASATELLQYIALVKALDDLNFKIADVTIAYNDLNEQVYETNAQEKESEELAKRSANAGSAQKKAASELANALAALATSYKLLTTAQEEANSAGGFTMATLKSMASQFPELQEQIEQYLSGLISEQELLAALADRYAQDEAKYHQYLLEKQGYNEEYVNSVVNSGADMVNYFAENYGIDLSNFKNYIEKKSAIQAAFDSYVAGGIAAYWSENGGYTDAFMRLDDHAKGEISGLISQYQQALGEADVFASYERAKERTSAVFSSQKSSSGGSGSSGRSEYMDAYNAYKTEADKKLALIKSELAAKKELRDKTIEYLDDEIRKRKELNEDKDIQKQIDQVTAQLKYAQLDDFSRAQLEKKLQSLQDEQEELLWQREMQKKKDAANAEYEIAAAEAAALQNRINESVNTFKEIMDALADGITNINNIINNNTVNNSANINLANQYLTMAQITKAVRDALIGDVTILTR